MDKINTLLSIYTNYLKKYKEFEIPTPPEDGMVFEFNRRYWSNSDGKIKPLTGPGIDSVSVSRISNYYRITKGLEYVRYEVHMKKYIRLLNVLYVTGNAIGRLVFEYNLYNNLNITELSCGDMTFIYMNNNIYEKADLWNE